MIQEPDFKEFRYNVLGLDSRITGDIVLKGDAIITSTIEGSIVMEGGGKLVLERGSRVKGTITAVDIDIFGVVEGEINATGTVSVRSSAFLSGRLNSAKLVIYPGAVLEMDITTQSQS